MKKLGDDIRISSIKNSPCDLMMVKLLICQLLGNTDIKTFSINDQRIQNCDCNKLLFLGKFKCITTNYEALLNK